MNSLSDILSTKEYTPGTSDQTPLTNVSTSSVPDYNPKMPESDSQMSNSASAFDTTQLVSMIHSMKDQLDSMLRLLNGEQVRMRTIQEPDALHLETGEKVIEGVFTGEKMLGPDGKEYSVPPNYASKSKLVEGDMMKLTITNNGSFLYKQIGPIERKRVVGELMCNPETGQWSVVAEGRTYKVLNASVSFYKGSAGDEVVILVPESGESQWGAVENIMHA